MNLWHKLSKETFDFTQEAATFSPKVTGLWTLREATNQYNNGGKLF
jgi:hypothetical protein